MRARARGGRVGREPRVALGAHLRARGPDAVAVGRRGAALDRAPARHAEEAAPARRPARALRRRRARVRHRLRPRAAARRRSSSAPPRLGLPLFEVPYEMPFIAITERAAAHLVNEQFDALERGAQVHERLERLVIEGRGLERDPRLDRRRRSAAPRSSLDAARPRARRAAGRRAGPIAPAAGAGVRRRARRARRRPASTRSEEPSLAGRALAVPVPGRGAGEPAAWLAVVADDGPARRVRAALRAPGGDGRRPRADARAGRPRDRAPARRRPARRRARRPRRRRRAARPAAPVRDHRRGRGARLRARRPAGRRGDARAGPDRRRRARPSSRRAPPPGKPLLVAVVDAGAGDPLAAARDGRAALAGVPGGNGVRAAASRPSAVGSLRRAFHEARCALEATSFANGEAPDVASHRDLGAFTLLLALQDDEALRLYSDGLLEPIERTEGEYGGELLRSLEAFIDNNGNWERAARKLYCHRHTLRYRIRKIEELTGRDLSRATDRIELWLALRARELVR